MGQYSSYFLYQKFEIRGSQEAIPVYPNVYSIDADGTREMVIKLENDPECGYDPPTPPMYKWVNIPITQDYICDDCPEYQTRWIRTDETTCIKEGPDPQYRWVNMDASVDYYCEGTTKYFKQKRQVSYDDGVTWQDVTPPEYQKGGVAEEQSTDCGYVPPTPIDYEKQYLTIVPREDVKIKFQPFGKTKYYDYSRDSGTTWVRASGATTISATTGEKIMFRGELTSRTDVTPFGSGTFSATTGMFDVEGNVMSLLYGASFIDRTSLSGHPYAFSSLFSGAKAVSVENLQLPATTLANNAYGYMFGGCRYLTNVPKVRGDYDYSVGADGCYQSMFSGCISLTKAPDKVSVGPSYDYSCRYMFSECTALTTSPELVIYKVSGNTCTEMFRDCTSLNYVKCTVNNISRRISISHWLDGVSPTGTFVTPASTIWSSGVNGIPTGWTRVDA